MWNLKSVNLGVLSRAFERKLIPFSETFYEYVDLILRIYKFGWIDSTLPIDSSPRSVI